MDYDSRWKEALDRYFPMFLALLFPKVYAAIDWHKGYTMLDKELQQIIPEAITGKLVVDKLVQVWLKDGTEEWILIHIEIQTWRETGFARRVNDYNYRIEQKYNREVISLAVLADDDAGWREDRYRWGKLDCSREFVFPIAKLLDFVPREAELERDANPFARFVLAHLKTRQTRQSPEDRLEWKTRIIQGLYDQQIPQDEVVKLFRFIDWIMELPKELSPVFLERLDSFKKEKTMPYVTQTEQLWLERGRKELLHTLLLEFLQENFGAAGQQFSEEVSKSSDYTQLREIYRAALEGNSLDQLRQLWKK